MELVQQKVRQVQKGLGSGSEKKPRKKTKAKKKKKKTSGSPGGAMRFNGANSDVNANARTRGGLGVLRSLEKSGTFNRRKSHVPPDAFIGALSSQGGNFSPALMRQTLVLFYARHDTEKHDLDDLLDTLLYYMSVKGVEALNVRLKEKYGENLDDIEVPDVGDYDDLDFSDDESVPPPTDEFGAVLDNDEPPPPPIPGQEGQEASAPPPAFDEGDEYDDEPGMPPPPLDEAQAGLSAEQLAVLQGALPPPPPDEGDSGAAPRAQNRKSLFARGKAKVKSATNTARGK